MNIKAVVMPVALSIVALIFCTAATVRAERLAAETASDAAIMTLYNVASAHNVESGDISFGSISSAASTRIEEWARQHNVSLGGDDYAFVRRGYTVVYSGKSYDCFRYGASGGHYIVCVRDDGTLLGAAKLQGYVPQPPQ